MSTYSLRIVMAQINPLVGAIEKNTQRIIDWTHQAKRDFDADLVVFPELVLCGYPPEDLLFRTDFNQRIKQGCQAIQAASQGVGIIIGYPEPTLDGYYNKASLFYQGELVSSAYKGYLPNYGVFDENRYFTSGHTPCVFSFKGAFVGLIICEDLWYEAPAAKAVKAGAELLIGINASPYHINKPQLRQDNLGARARDNAVPLLYLNLLGGQDELLFDGGSMIFDAQGQLSHYQRDYQELLIPVDCQRDQAGRMTAASDAVIDAPRIEEQVYGALCLGLKDYVRKNGFDQVLVGLSGGIDSALTLAIAVDALGADQVTAVLMPSQYTAETSLKDAWDQVGLLNVSSYEINIESTYHSFVEALAEPFEGLDHDTTEENIQARVRGTLIMALSNKFNGLVLTTGNKSELAVGYSTLYGDMAGGFCVLKDVPKTLVYQLAQYRNGLGQAIPDHVIHKAPTAELAPGQMDQDALPPYEVLDELLTRYVEKRQSKMTLIEAGFDEALVHDIVKRLHRNEYKRRQAPPGVKITPKAFGRDRRYPITSGYE